MISTAKRIESYLKPFESTITLSEDEVLIFKKDNKELVTDFIALIEDHKKHLIEYGTANKPHPYVNNLKTLYGIVRKHYISQMVLNQIEKIYPFNEYRHEHKGVVIGIQYDYENHYIIYKTYKEYIKFLKSILYYTGNKIKELEPIPFYFNISTGKNKEIEEIYKKLIEYGMIDGSKVNFRKVLNSNSELRTVNWLSGLSSLHFFLQRLNRRYRIKHVYKIATKVFLNNGNDILYTTQLTKSGKPGIRKKKMIENIFNHLK